MSHRKFWSEVKPTACKKKRFLRRRMQCTSTGTINLQLGYMEIKADYVVRSSTKVS